MKKPVCTIKAIRNEIKRRGYDPESLYFPRSSDYLLFSCYNCKEDIPRHFFIYDKFSKNFFEISEDIYYRYIDEIDNLTEMSFNLYRFSINKKKDFEKLESIKDYLLRSLLDRLSDFVLEVGEDYESSKYFSPEDFTLVLYADEYNLLKEVLNG